MDKKAVLEALGALSQETRLDVFRLLVQAGPEGLPVGEIASHMGVRQNTMSTNLGILARAGLVSSVRRGRSIHYNADYDAMQALLGYLIQDCCGGEPAICAPLLKSISRCC